MSRLTFGLFGVYLLLASGCHSAAALPKTYPASGSVVYKGGKPMRGGSVQFTSLKDPSLRVVGLIRDDGTFTLETIGDRDKVSGAPEGEYQVSIIPPLEGGHKGLPPISLPKSCKVEATENRFRLELHVPRPRS